MKHPKPKKTEFDKLKEEWYQKLKDDGFVDIETDEPNLSLTEWSNRWTRQSRYHERAEEVLAYNDFASQMLHEYEFESELHKVIWEYHVNGLSYREIAKVLVETKVLKKASYGLPYKVIKKYRAIMLDKYVNTTNA